jgi:GTP pyrophosphokinase
VAPRYDSPQMAPTSSLPAAPDRDAGALDAAAALLDAAGHEHAAVQRAREVAAIVQQLTADATLATAALVQVATQGASDERTLNAAQRAELGVDVLRLAEQLDKLGNFQLEAHWSSGKSLAGRQAETLRKMLLAVVGDPRLVVARLAEQLVRIRHARDLPADQRRQVALEVEELYAPLANRLGIWTLKWELEDLAFRTAHPDDYQRIAQALNEKRRDRERYIEETRALLSTALARAGITAEVAGRPKHIYSIWRKMQRKRLSFEQLYDIRALRIIVGTVADCYAALGVVHELWRFLPSEFDDYIATPKDNDYQSIHTAVNGPDGRPLEVQIRTRGMQEQSELGVAAHWRYKEGGADRRYDDKIQQVRELLAGNQAGADADALTRLSAGLFKDRIYAMTPKGEVVDLPQGGTPVDFAFHVHSSLGERCKGAKVNGRIAPLNQPLRSGDVIEIITGKEPAPSRDWLSDRGGYVVSSRSKAKLRAYFRRVDEAAGNAHAPVAAPEPPPPAPQAPPPSARPRKAIGSARSPVAIDGVGDLAITLARCCAPMRPQPIRGYLTLGRGVTIHRADCAALIRMAKQKPQRLLQVEWAEGETARIGATMTIEAFDRRGLLRDISDLIAEEHLSIEGVTSATDPRDRIARFEVRLAVRDASELAKLQRRLARIPNVIKVRRAR